MGFQNKFVSYHKFQIEQGISRQCLKYWLTFSVIAGQDIKNGYFFPGECMLAEVLFDL